jgi:hypothetical protein
MGKSPRKTLTLEEIPETWRQRRILTRKQSLPRYGRLNLSFKWSRRLGEGDEQGSQLKKIQKT